MSESTVLDVLLAAIIVLIALIGYWQGIVRSLLVICGALVGSELALWWSDETGDRIADILPFNADTGRFITATAMIVGASLLLGVLLGNMVSHPVSGIRERLSGIGVSLVSALLIIGLIIRYFHIHMFARADDALSDARLANALWEQFDWILLASTLGGAGLLVLLWVLGAPESAAPGIESRSEPSRSWSAAPLSQTRVSSQPLRREPAPTSSNNDYAARSANDGGGSKRDQPVSLKQHAAELEDDRTSRSDDAPRPKSAPGAPTSAVRSSVAPGTTFERQYAPVAETLSFSEDITTSDNHASSGICPNCGMLLTSGDQFCPDCGNPVD